MMTVSAEEGVKWENLPEWFVLDLQSNKSLVYGRSTIEVCSPHNMIGVLAEYTILSTMLDRSPGYRSFRSILVPSPISWPRPYH